MRLVLRRREERAARLERPDVGAVEVVGDERDLDVGRRALLGCAADAAREVSLSQLVGGEGEPRWPVSSWAKEPSSAANPGRRPKARA